MNKHSWLPFENILQHHTLNDGPVLSSSLPAPAHPFETELLLVNTVDDVLHVLMDPTVLSVMKFTGETSVDSDGVSRGPVKCSGNSNPVPALQPDCSEKSVVERKPARLSPGSVITCCRGLGSVDEELLMIISAHIALKTLMKLLRTYWTSPPDRTHLARPDRTHAARPDRTHATRPDRTHAACEPTLRTSSS